MAYKILTGQCSACGACEFDCPNSAITMKGDNYVITAAKCGECEGFFDAPQCVALCPSEAIVHA